MSLLERVGVDARSDRSLFVLDAPCPADVPSELDVDGQFVCLLAWDATTVPGAEVSTLADRLLQAGCVYICAWGPACDRVHASFDEAAVTRSPEGPCVMSTSHEGESLEVALWFLLVCASPDHAFADGCRSAVAISIGAPSWAAAMRAAMVDPDGFTARVVGDG